MALRLLIVTFQFPPEIGGVQTLAYQLSSHLAQAGVELSVLARAEPGAAAFDAAQPFAIRRIMQRIPRTPWGKLWQKVRFVGALAREIDTSRPDYILTLQWDPFGYLLRLLTALRRRPLPYGVAIHGTDLLELPVQPLARRLKGWLRAVGLNGAAHIFVSTTHSRERVAALGIGPANIRVIRNGIPFRDEIGPAESDGPPILLTTARLIWRKGHETVLRALPRILAAFPETRYQIVGEGPERPRLEALARELGVAARVTFCGQVAHAERERLLRAATLFVLPCRESPTDYEGFGIAFLEAMQHGKAVIGGRSGGVPDVVLHGETGLLVPPDDPEALATTILALLRQPDEAARLGRNGWEHARSHYRWDLIAAEYVAAMREVCL